MGFGPAGWGVGFEFFDAGGFDDGGGCFGWGFGGFLGGRLGGLVFAAFLRARRRIGVVVATACFDHGSGSRVVYVSEEIFSLRVGKLGFGFSVSVSGKEREI